MYLENITPIPEESLDEALKLDIRTTYAFDQPEEEDFFITTTITEVTSSYVCFGAQTGY